ncbi:MAG: thiamine phosphate synthase [Deltaproteobacteria bacterium]|nr:thiamine phosphate synthase [Deltaproteobacteria bacterium]
MTWSGVHVIADMGASPSRSPLDIANAALAGGVRIIQVRAKGAASRDLLEAAISVATAVRSCQDGRLVVNDRFDVALAAGADAVHLGQDDLPAADARKAIEASGARLTCGISTHDIGEARRAEQAGAAYVGFGPIFQTGSKANPLPPRGLEVLAEVCRTLSIPVIAIGGIDLEGARAARRAGAAGVAVISAVAAAPDMSAAARALVGIFSTPV